LLQSEQTSLAEQEAQLAILQVGVEQVLLLRTKFPEQAEQTLGELQEVQLAILHYI